MVGRCPEGFSKFGHPSRCLGSYWGEPTIPPGRTCTGKSTAPFHGALNYLGFPGTDTTWARRHPSLSHCASIRFRASSMSHSSIGTSTCFVSTFSDSLRPPSLQILRDLRLPLRCRRVGVDGGDHRKPRKATYACGAVARNRRSGRPARTRVACRRPRVKSARLAVVLTSLSAA